MWSRRMNPSTPAAALERGTLLGTRQLPTTPSVGGGASHLLRRQAVAGTWVKVDTEAGSDV
jgi:hypothetical protein